MLYPPKSPVMGGRCLWGPQTPWGWSQSWLSELDAKSLPAVVMAPVQASSLGGALSIPHAVLTLLAHHGFQVVATGHHQPEHSESSQHSQCHQYHQPALCGAGGAGDTKRPRVLPKFPKFSSKKGGEKWGGVILEKSQNTHKNSGLLNPKIPPKILTFGRKWSCL